MTELTAHLHRLGHLGTLLVTGPEAKPFLQGQLSFDVDRLTPERVELATCNSAQGRVQAVVWLIERNEGVALLMPSSLIDATAARLRKYVLRAKAKIESARNRLDVFGAVVDLPGDIRLHRQDGERSYIRWPGDASRWLCIAEANTNARTDLALESEWRRADIAAGLPQVYPPTQEHFVAQMLNVDILEGISFEKGCYTGQEIIARTHFRGAIKRRMFRFSAIAAAPEPGTRIVAGDQHAGDVVDAVGTSQGCELLAVVTLSHLEGSLELDIPERARLERLPLPYQV